MFAKGHKMRVELLCGCKVCSTITNSGLIQATTFSFENIVGFFRRSNSQRNFFIIISTFSDISVDDERKRKKRLAFSYATDECG